MATPYESSPKLSAMEGAEATFSEDIEDGKGTSLYMEITAVHDLVEVENDNGSEFPSVQGGGNRFVSTEGSPPGSDGVRFDSMPMPDLMERFFRASFVEQKNDDDGRNGGPFNSWPVDKSLSMGESSGGRSRGDSGCVLETEFDVTEERLRRLFNVFDLDQDGRISYDKLRRGLDYHTTSFESSVDEESFQVLLHHLDMDNSGDISFEEFSEGIRLIMLRSLFCTVASANIDDNSILTEVFDYNSQRLERLIVAGFRQRRQVDVTATSSTVSTMSVQDFFFSHRPEWITMRWINITGANASHILKMTALRYKLHPLALEDALEVKHHRPKAESYTTHYTALVPIFYLARDGQHKDDDRSGKGKVRSRFWGQCFQFRKTRNLKEDLTKSVDTTKSIDTGKEHSSRRRVKKIGVHMTSMFVLLPDFKTVITFTNERHGMDIRLKIDKRNRTSLEKCWSRVQGDLKKSYSKLREYDGRYLAYSLLDQAVDFVGPIVKELRQAIWEEKEELRSRKFKDMAYIHLLRDELKTMTRKIKPFERLLVHIIEDGTISPGITPYIRDVLYNLEHYDEEVKELIDLCESTDVEAENFRQRQLSSTLYTLTAITATFLPAQFLTGVWGMNFEDMRELHEPWGYKMFWGLAAFVMTTTFLTLNCGRLRY